MAEYLNINNILTEKSLTIVPLKVLKTISDTYAMSLMQPSGIIDFSSDGVKNNISNNADKKYFSFLNKAHSDNINLAITPEYSCPWNVLQKCLDEGILPNDGAIWILGCESIKYDELNQFKSSNENIEFIYENITPDYNRNFYSPVCYIFNTKDSEDNKKTVILVQFKTQHMSDPIHELEVSHIIYGTKRYWISNDVNSIYLSALICAESLAQNPINDFDNTKSYLITHLQLNTKPFNSSYSQYRKNLFMADLNIEIISLNWAKGFQLQVGGHISDFGGSAIYAKIPKIKLDDLRMNKNHKKGLYYSFENSMKYDILNLNYDEHVFYLKNYNINQCSDIAILESRLGIEALNTFHWENRWIECTSCDDKSESYLNTQIPIINELPLINKSAIARERFLSLTSGNIHPSKDWKNPKQLESFRVREDGECNRYTIYDNTTDKNLVLQNIIKITILNRDLINNSQVVYPEKFKELYNNCKLVALEEKSLSQFNVYKEDDKFPATFVYLGDKSEVNAQEAFDKISKALECANRRLIVWYKNLLDGNYKFICDESVEQIDDDCSATKIAIDKEDE